jgi:alpha-tubulin suppressor-like RCC1 family protein
MSKRSRSGSRDRSKSPVKKSKKNEESEGEEGSKKKSRPKNQLLDMKHLLLNKKKSVVASIYGLGNNVFGQLGNDPKTEKYSSPVLIGSKKLNVMDYACGSYFSVFAETSSSSKYRRVWVWGTMNYTRDTEKKEDKKNDDLGHEPTSVAVLKKKFVVQVTAGDAHASALTIEGEVYTWGIYKNNKGINCGFKSNAPKDEFQDEPDQIFF